MDDNKNTTSNLQNQDVHHQDQDEEALSLTGLILNSSEVEVEVELNLQHQGSASSSADHFEFLLDRNSEMSHAEDMISCGKLIPYKERRPHPHDHRETHHFLKPPADDQKKHSFHSRRSESLNDIGSTGLSNSALMRNSRSLDYGKLYGSRSSYRWMENLEIERSSSTKSGISGARGGGRFDPTKEKMVPTPRLRWYMMFGALKFPPEMDFHDIKSRQVRLNNASGEGKALVNRVRCSSSWHLLRVLSCKDHASVAVTTPFGRLQQI